MYVALAILFSLIPPLTDRERGRLETAVDGRDHREEAFVALVEHVSAWTDGAHDTPIRIDPDLDRLLDDPDAARGDLCRVNGVVQQSTRLAPPHDGVREWFVRIGDRPVIVYVVGDVDAGLGEGAPIVIDARFYKGVDFTARDGVARRYPAFVGRFPRLVRGEDSTAGSWVLVAPVGIMLLVFLALLVYARRLSGRGRARPDRPRTAPEVDDAASLPDDPADALAELRRRAEDE